MGWPHVEGATKARSPLPGSCWSVSTTGCETTTSVGWWDDFRPPTGAVWVLVGSFLTPAYTAWSSRVIDLAQTFRSYCSMPPSRGEGMNATPHGRVHHQETSMENAHAHTFPLTKAG